MRPAAWRRRAGGQDGAAVTEFVLIAPLVLFLFLGLVQVALFLHAHDVLVADAAEGARYAANAGVTPSEGDARCIDDIRESLSPSLLRPRVCRASLQRGPAGLLEIRMQVSAVIPLAVLPLGEVHVEVVGHALAEP